MSDLSAPAIVTRANLDSDPLKRDFRNFMTKSWDTWFQERPTERMYEIGNYLQHGPDKSIVMGFRGLAKSFVTVDYAVWLLYCDPTLLVLNLAGSGKGAGGNAFLAFSMVKGWDWLEHMAPRGIDRYSALAFDVHGSRHEKSESFASLSVLSGDKTGRRCDVLIPDDVETPTTSASETDRIALRVHVAEAAGALLKQGGKVKVLGTPQTENTIYREQAVDKGYAMRIWPVLYPKAPYKDAEGKTVDEIAKYGPWLAPTIRKELEANPHLAGTTTEPTRFPEGNIVSRKLEYGSVEFARQFLLHMDAGGGASRPLHLRDCPVVDIPEPTFAVPLGGKEPKSSLKVPSEVAWTVDPARLVKDLPLDALDGDGEMFYPTDSALYRDAWQTPENVVMHIDPSGSGSDETCWMVGAQHLGRVFALAWGARLEGFGAATIAAIVEDVKVWRPHRIVIEKNFGQGMFAELLRPALQKAGCMCSVEDESAGGVMKEQRIVDSLEALIGEHRLVFNRAALKRDYQVSYPEVADAKRRYYRLTYQLTRIIRQKGALPHDDRVDALSGLCLQFLGTIRRNVEQAAREAREAEIDLLSAKHLEVLRRQARGDDIRGVPGGGRRLALTESPLFRGRKR